MHRIRKGLDLPISGTPEQVVEDGPALTRVAVMGDDTPGLRARLAVAEGDPVKRGQLLFEDRARPGIRYTSPAEGQVSAVFRGARRSLRSLVVQLSEAERSGRASSDGQVRFASLPAGEPTGAEQVKASLVESGLWTALRERPYGKVPLPETTPHALFVTAIDTNPHAPDPEVVIAAAREDFQRGLRALALLCPGTTYLCVAAGSAIPSSVDAPVQVEEFKGPHPAGNAGVHIHLLAPVSRSRVAWYLGYQDVIAAGRLFASGNLSLERVVSLAGPVVRRPRLLRTRLGASIDELARGEIEEGNGDVRLLSGSVLSGKKAQGLEFGFLGRYHLQVSALAEGNQRHFFGWARPGAEKFSVLPVFVSRLLGRKSFDMTTDTNGSRRAIMPIGTYERVMPMDIVATYLLRSIVVGDLETAENLGALELDEEDLALCTFVCPGKTDFAPYLRKSLELLEKEG